MEKRSFKGDLAYEEIKKMIMKNKIPDDTLLNENAFVEMLGVSRTPIRAALMRLQEEKLIAIFPKHGIKIKTISTDELKQLYELRLAIEKYIICKTCCKLTEEDIGNMQALLDSQKKAVEENNMDYFLTLDAEFHEYFFKYFDNDIMMGVLENFRDRTYSIKKRASFNANLMQMAYKEHLDILSGLREKNVQEVDTAYEAHIRNGLSRILI